jgi:PAS domain-containing protein
MTQELPWSRQALLQSPLFAALHPILASLEEEQFPTLQTCNALLARQPGITVQQGWPLRFIAQPPGKQSFELQYEPRCYLKGELQMRENNWHDLFNALVWMTFPKSKAAINARHYHAINNNAAMGATGSQRGAMRDTNTLLDESGVIVACSDAEMRMLLENFQWQELFWRHRERVKSGMGFYIFGHGLYEKAMRPFVGITGQGVVLTVAPAFFTWSLPRQLAHLDKLLAGNLAMPARFVRTDSFAPVPLLGVPGWMSDNENLSFYQNVAYFRCGRRRPV